MLDGALESLSKDSDNVNCDGPTGGTVDISKEGVSVIIPVGSNYGLALVKREHKMVRAKVSKMVH